MRSVVVAIIILLSVGTLPSGAAADSSVDASPSSTIHYTSITEKDQVVVFNSNTNNWTSYENLSPCNQGRAEAAVPDNFNPENLKYQKVEIEDEPDVINWKDPEEGFEGSFIVCILESSENNQWINYSELSQCNQDLAQQALSDKYNPKNLQYQRVEPDSINWRHPEVEEISGGSGQFTGCSISDSTPTMSPPPTDEPTETSPSDNPAITTDTPSSPNSPNTISAFINRLIIVLISKEAVVATATALVVVGLVVWWERTVNE